MVAKNRVHRGGVHDTEILIAVIEDRECAFNALFFEVTHTLSKQPKLSFRIQIFEALGCGNIAFEPILAVLTMKTDIRLLPGGFDEPDGTIESSTGASTEV